MTAPVRAGDVLCALSLATDLGTGQPLEHGLRTCAAATALARAASVEGDALRDVHCLGLLHSLGCTADAFEAARMYGDDVALRAGYATVDASRPLEVLGFLGRHVGAGRPPLRRGASLAHLLAAGRTQARTGFTAHCEVGRRLAERLGLSPGVQDALWFVFERWDGKGQPAGARGDAIPLAARILHVARDAVVFARMAGPGGAREVISNRAGGAYEPRLVALLDDQVLAAAADATWDSVLARDSAPRGTLSAADLDAACAAVADFADLKSPALLGHAGRTAELAEAAAWRLSLDEPRVVDVRRAALLADLGRVAISNAIWDKPGPLSESEWERVRLHPYFTERAVARSPGLAALGAIASAHHERVGAGGYHRGVDAAALPPEARIVAAADAYAAMTEERPHRDALAPDAAASQLRTASLDREAVEAVLAAAGHPAQPVRLELPAGLSEREAQVLVLLARGHSNKEIGARLGISPKTAGHHVGHVYAKIGVSTRAAAALYAVEHRLFDRANAR